MRYNKVAVTGASGFVGSHLIAKLLHLKVDEIVCLVRNSNSIDKLNYTLYNSGCCANSKKMIIKICDLSDVEAIREAISGCQVMFHTAAKVSFSAADNKTIVNDNVLITEAIVEASKECKIEHFINLSSIAALGDNDEGLLVNEKSIPKSLSKKSPYSTSKFLSENVIWRAALKGLNVTSLLPAVIIGRGNPKSGGTPLLTEILSKRSLFYSDGVTGYVMVEDVVDAMIAVVGREECFGERYLVCSENLSYREVITALSGHRPKIRVCKGSINFIKRVVNLLSLLKIELPIGESLLNNLVEKHFYDGNLISKSLGFNYRRIKNETE